MLLTRDPRRSATMPSSPQRETIIRRPTSRIARLDSLLRARAATCCWPSRTANCVAALAGDRVIADPFRPSSDIVALLRVRAGRGDGRTAVTA